jgi:hypothetical protein
MDGVQSFGEKRAFGEQIGWLCLSAVQSSNEKSLLSQGLFAREFIQRIRGLGQSGGGRGTGIEPSLRSHVTESNQRKRLVKARTGMLAWLKAELKGAPQERLGGLCGDFYKLLVG